MNIDLISILLDYKYLDKYKYCFKLFIRVDLEGVQPSI